MKKKTTVLFLVATLAITMFTSAAQIVPTAVAANTTAQQYQKITDKNARKDVLYWSYVNLKQLGLPENDAAIIRIHELWWLEAGGVFTGDFAYGKTIADYTPTSNFGNTTQNTTTSYNGINLYDGVIDVHNRNFVYAAKMLARIIYAYGYNLGQTEQAAIGWTVLNAIDSAGTNATIDDVISRFDYGYDWQTVDINGRDLIKLSHDLIYRWQLEKSASYSGLVGRVIPKEYTRIVVRNGINHFYPAANRIDWDFSLSSPYAT